MSHGKSIDRILLDDLMARPTHSGEGAVAIDPKTGTITLPFTPEEQAEIEVEFGVHISEDAPVEVRVRNRKIERAVEFGRAFAEAPNPVNSRKKSPYKKRPKRSR